MARKKKAPSNLKPSTSPRAKQDAPHTCDARKPGGEVCGAVAGWFDNKRDLGMCDYHMTQLSAGRHQSRTGFRRVQPR